MVWHSRLFEKEINLMEHKRGYSVEHQDKSIPTDDAFRRGSSRFLNEMLKVVDTEINRNSHKSLTCQSQK